ncbi:hypothetical protein C8A01DRAFT_15332 [Parachaetomium inaequale]|uniref:Uncharacterized protein n=1 Tax=Parachaetomium inaequale TaxID=2588326 RepID=A0AAN6PH89_9PEZI|nr:hypothetical protein C8A01DRAFT_15332 [Parachaetomium inaequale]
MLCRKSLTSFAGIALLSLASAQESEDPDSWGAYGFPDYKFGPWGVPDVTFERLMKAPNATSNYPLQAPDTSSPFPAPGPIDGWSLSLSVVADVPMSESNMSLALVHPNDTFTGSRLVLQTPTGSDSAFDESWSVCVIQWSIDLKNYPAKLREDDGSCSSVLSEQCARDLEKAAREQYITGRSRSRQCPCPWTADIPSCAGEQAEALSGNGACSSQGLSADDINRLSDGQYRVLQYGGPLHERGNRTAYDESGSLAWPMMVLWGPSENATGGSPGADGVVAKLSCPRAKEATQGSTAPRGGAASDTNAGNGETGLSSMMLVAGVLLTGGWASL